MSNIRRGDIWTAYNPKRTVLRQVVVLSNDEYNKFSTLYTVVPLDDFGSTFEHPHDVRVRGKNVAIDLISTIHSDYLQKKQSSVSASDLRNISEAVIKHLSLHA
ncbi:MAG: type II toxin-antitoxin system PemK/MazF family toxin [Bacteroidota bacterium]